MKKEVRKKTNREYVAEKEKGERNLGEDIVVPGVFNMEGNAVMRNLLQHKFGEK